MEAYTFLQQTHGEAYFINLKSQLFMFDNDKNGGNEKKIKKLILHDKSEGSNFSTFRRSQT